MLLVSVQVVLRIFRDVTGVWNRLAQTSIWIWSDQYIWSHCIFMLDCLAWHLSTDNLWHIWCQSAITFLIKGPQIMNIFFRWQEMLVMSWAWFVESIFFTVDWIFGYESMCLTASKWIYILGSVSTASTVAKCGTYAVPQRKPGKRH